MKPGLYIKKVKKGWCWNAVAKNGRIVANGEVFSSRAKAKKGILAAWRVLKENIFFDRGHFPTAAICENID